MANLALFDFDETITRADTFTPFIYDAVDSKRMALGKLILSPLIAAYKLGALSTSTMRSIVVAFEFRGRREADVRAAALHYARNRLAEYRIGQV